MKTTLLFLVLSASCFANPVKRQLNVCPTVSTFTAPPAIVTYVEDDIGFTSAIETITIPRDFTTTTTYTTSYSAVSATCFTSGTTLAPTTLPALPFKRDEKAPVATAAASLAPTPKINLGYVSADTVAIIETFFNPLNPRTCTAVEQDFIATTSTVSETITIYGLTTTLGPVSTLTATRTVVQPTPASYDGVNWYQYTNTYAYPSGGPPSPKDTAGFGAGGYLTSDWRGNYNYQDNGLQKYVHVETENYRPDPHGPTACKLQGQPSLHDCAQWTVVFQGFLFAKETGNYTVTIPPTTDNELLIWGGDKAYRSYTDNNCDALGVSGPGDQEGKPTAYTYSLVAGQLFPMTFIASNGGGPMNVGVDVSGPFVDAQDYLVPPCDASVFVP